MKFWTKLYSLDFRLKLFHKQRWSLYSAAKFSSKTLMIFENKHVWYRHLFSSDLGVKMAPFCFQKPLKTRPKNVQKQRQKMMLLLNQFLSILAPFWSPFGTMLALWGGEFGIKNRSFFVIPLQTPPGSHFDRILVDFGAPKTGFGIPFWSMLGVWEANWGSKITYFLGIHL